MVAKRVSVGFGSFRFFFILIALSTSGGCLPFSPPSPNPDTIQSLVVLRPLLSEIQDPTERLRYSVEPVSLKSLRNLNRLETEGIRIFELGRQTSTEVQEDTGKILVFEKTYLKNAPQILYTEKNGIAIPKDFNTLALFSVLYHFEGILQSLPELVGFDVQPLIRKQGPIEVFYEPFVSVSLGPLEWKSFQKSNAHYLPGSNFFFLEKKSEAELLPFSSALEVLAHEFGHAVWEYLMAEIPNDSALESNFVLRGLNEGFADFFSYTLTGSTHVLANTIQDNSNVRNFSNLSFTHPELGSIPQCKNSFYCIGSLFAASLYQAQLEMGLNPSKFEDRASFLREVISVFTKMRATFPSNLEAVFITSYSPNSRLAGLRGPFSPNSLDLSQFFTAFLAQISQRALRQAFCKSLDKNFGETGFPVKNRRYCSEERNRE